MDYEDLAADAQRRLNTVVLADFRREFQAFREEPMKHLVDCATTTATVTDGGDGGYGCDTGCEFVRLNAVIGCQCGILFHYEYGTFGELEWLIERMGDV